MKIKVFVVMARHQQPDLLFVSKAAAKTSGREPLTHTLGELLVNHSHTEWVFSPSKTLFFGISANQARQIADMLEHLTYHQPTKLFTLPSPDDI